MELYALDRSYTWMLRAWEGTSADLVISKLRLCRQRIAISDRGWLASCRARRGSLRDCGWSAAVRTRRSLSARAVDEQMRDRSEIQSVASVPLRPIDGVHKSSCRQDE